MKKGVIMSDNVRRLRTARDNLHKLEDRGIVENNLTMEQITAIRIAEFAIDEICSTDAQPVKCGYWETWGYVFHGIEWKRCSVCGKTADVSYKALLEGRIEPVTLSLCGCCGARMDGDTYENSCTSI